MSDARVLLAGDVHGNCSFVITLLDQARNKGCDRIVQLGDWGAWEHEADGRKFVQDVERHAARRGIGIWWLDGNHDKTSLTLELHPDRDDDDFHIVTDHVRYIPRGHRWTWNGVRFAAFGGAYCVVPETQVLTADLRWRQAGDLRADDKLIGFDEEISLGPGKNVRLQESKVESTGRTVLPCYRITTDRGPTVVSSEHLMIWKRSVLTQSKKEWREASRILPGEAVQWLTTPWDEDTSRDAGYIAGIFDGEGWIDHTRIAFAQNPGLVLDKALSILHAKGFQTSQARQARDAVCERVDVIGGKWESLRLLGSVRPERLLASASRLWDGREIIGKGKETKPGKAWAVVTSVEFVGPREVVTLKTSTRTFIADGFAAHNSVDKQWRLDREKRRKGPGTLWFPEEQMTDAEFYRHLADPTSVDVLLSHDKPSGSRPDWNRKDLPGCLPNQERIQTAAQVLTPRLLVHGHLHYRYTDRIRVGGDWCRVEGLAADPAAMGQDYVKGDSWMVLDLQESDWDRQVAALLAGAEKRREEPAAPDDLDEIRRRLAEYKTAKEDADERP